VIVINAGTVQLPVGVTLYVVVVVGATVMAAIVAPVLHVYPVPPDAVMVVLVPAQIVGADGENVIQGVTTVKI
jgi:hypothetical protein